MEGRLALLINHWKRSAVVMQAWRVFLSAVHFTLIVNFLRDFSFFPDYLLYLLYCTYY